MKKLAVLMMTMGVGLAAQTFPARADEPAASTSATTVMTEGEVLKVDPTARTLMLKHGDIPNLGMPAMTMSFKVADPTLLTRVKPGDKLRFTADRINGALTVTGIQMMN